MSIRDRAEAALRQSSSPDIRGLTVQQDDSSVVLHGHVSSFYHKQLAQELVRNKIGGVKVVNRTEVIYRHDGD
jgi:osmotically-inducible protein OsmY